MIDNYSQEVSVKVMELDAKPVTPTLRANIDGKIAMHKEQINRLESIKKQFEGTGMLDMNLSDMREAMRY